MTPVLYRNNVRVRNVQIVRNVRNMLGPRLFGTFGQHWPTLYPNLVNIYTTFFKMTKVDMLKIGDVSFDFGFEW